MSDVVIFFVETGIMVTVQANTIFSVHCYNKAVVHNMGEQTIQVPWNSGGATTTA